MAHKARMNIETILRSPPWISRLRNRNQFTDVQWNAELDRIAEEMRFVSDEIRTVNQAYKAEREATDTLIVSLKGLLNIKETQVAQLRLQLDIQRKRED